MSGRKEPFHLDTFDGPSPATRIFGLASENMGREIRSEVTNFVSSLANVWRLEELGECRGDRLPRKQTRFRDIRDTSLYVCLIGPLCASLKGIMEPNNIQQRP